MKKLELVEERGWLEMEGFWRVFRRKKNYRIFYSFFFYEFRI